MAHLSETVPQTGRLKDSIMPLKCVSISYFIQGHTNSFWKMENGRISIIVFVLYNLNFFYWPDGIPFCMRKPEVDNSWELAHCYVNRVLFIGINTCGIHLDVRTRLKLYKRDILTHVIKYIFVYIHIFIFYSMYIKISFIYEFIQGFTCIFSYFHGLGS